MAHLLLLALSMLPRRTSRIKDLPINEFYSEPEGSEQDPIIYIGQMEPILLWKAQEYAGDRINVLVLCSRQVMCNDFSSEEPVTDAQFFMKNVCEQLETQIDLSAYRKDIFNQQEFTSEDERLHFTLVPIDEEEVTPGIAASVELIRRWKYAPENSGARFWIDAHGAFRSTMTILTGMVSLLKVDGIVPDAIHAANYANNVMRLADGREAFDFFEFVSGMNDFINYGNADVLRSYFSKKKVSGREADVLEAIDKIALGTQCCDTISYKQGLNVLERYIKSGEVSQDSLLGVFLGYIGDSYGDLLSKKKRSTLLIVKRCREKKLYQQALTFIESSMPQEIVKKRLLTFALSNYEDEENKNNADGEMDYYFFDSYLKMGDFYPMRSSCTLKEAVKHYVQQKEELLRVLDGGPASGLNIDTYINTADGDNSIPFDKAKTSRLRGLPGTLKGIGSDVPAKDLDALGIFLRMHQLLKKCRNIFNHSLDDRPELEDILTLLDLYIQFAEYLYQAASSR